MLAAARQDEVPIQSVLIIEVVVLVPDGHVLDCLALLLLLVLALHAVLEGLRDLLVHQSLLLAGYYIEVGVVLLDDVLGAHVAVDLLALVVAAQRLAAAGALVGVGDGVVAEAEWDGTYPLEFFLF